MLLGGKVVIVAGAGGGLGAAIARICAREGAAVVVSDIHERAASSVSAGIQAGSTAVRCDVTRDEDLARLVDHTIEQHGRIDGLVNNAGVDFSRPFLETTPEDWDRVIATNLRPGFFLTQKVCRHMLRQDPPGGSIVNISSVHSIAGMAGAARMTPRRPEWPGLPGALRSNSRRAAFA